MESMIDRRFFEVPSADCRAGSVLPPGTLPQRLPTGGRLPPSAEEGSERTRLLQEACAFFIGPRTYRIYPK